MSMEIKRGLARTVLAAVCLTAGGLTCVSAVLAQNPPADGTQKPATTPPKQESNPFPEDTSKVPVFGSSSAPAVPPGTESGESSRLPLPGDNVDPVRSPDDAASGDGAVDNVVGTNSSSSQAGMDKILPSMEGDDTPQGKHKKLAVKAPEHQETSAEDIEVGKYYLDTKNWKAALSRFESAMVLAPDEPDVYWGLAESDRHLGNLAEARTYYKKVAEYDPDSKHGKEAIKALKDPEIANAKAAAPAN
jgi:hypothetical protein